MEVSYMLRLKSGLISLALLVAIGVISPAVGGTSLASGTIHWTYYDYDYTPISDISIAGGSGQLLTQILGNPFNVDQEQFDKAVTDAMYGAHFGPATHFTAAPYGDFKRIYYVRLGFGGDSPLGINTICTIPPAPPERNAMANGSASLSAAFCQEGRVLTYLEASGSGYAGPSDPRFAEFIRNVTFKLFPPNNPNNPNFRSGQPDHCHRHLSC
jgi:hypothetical protein